ncbi:MAG: hypothetical protein JSR82_22775 [Verrucomicrobia bacterium]|nr:hypothetical protein [Verrucomicrobiota bacterium]
MKTPRILAALLACACALGVTDTASAQKSSAGLYKATVPNNGPVLYLSVEGGFAIQAYAFDSVNRRIGVARGAILSGAFTLNLTNGATVTGSFDAESTQATGTYAAGGSTLNYTAPRVAFRSGGSEVAGIYGGASYKDERPAAGEERARALFVAIDQDNRLAFVETARSGAILTFVGGLGTVTPPAEGATDYTFTIDTPTGSTTPITGTFAREGGKLEGTYTASAGPRDFSVFKVRFANRLVNMSTRGFVNTGAGQLIAGFVVSGGPREVVVVARGPSLAAFGVTPALADPKLALMRGQTVLAENDNWSASPKASTFSQLSFLGALQPAESVISMVLEPGAYTAVVRGVNDTTGIALVEVYEIGWE